MKKNARPQTSETSAPTKRHFTITSPRELRAIDALLTRPMPREHLDKAAGCSNGPALVAQLRERGLEIPCTRVDALDRDGAPCRPGVYSLTDADRRTIHAWLRKRQQGRIAPEVAAALATLAPFALLAALPLLRLLGLV